MAFRFIVEILFISWMKGNSIQILGRIPLHKPDEEEKHEDSWAESSS
nr:hypothetical protein [Fredinandcohnia onubensis]